MLRKYPVSYFTVVFNFQFNCPEPLRVLGFHLEELGFRILCLCDSEPGHEGISRFLRSSTCRIILQVLLRNQFQCSDLGQNLGFAWIYMLFPYIQMILDRNREKTNFHFYSTFKGEFSMCFAFFRNSVELSYMQTSSSYFFFYLCF